MQDQAFLGPESGPGGAGRGRRRRPVRRHPVAARRPAADRRRASGCREEKVRLTLAGVGGAFGAREDLSMQVHACLLALRTGKPVKMVYGREESFFGHVHRHPARLRYEHGATRDGRLVYVKATHRARRRRVRLHLAGGRGATPPRSASARTRCRTWRSTPTASTPTTRRAGRCAASARCRPASRTSRRWTSWPPALGLDPVEVRVRNAMTQGSVMPTGQVVDGAGAGGRAARAGCAPSRPPPRRPTADLRELPGGVANTTHGEGVRPRRRLRRRHQEHLLLRGLRRLLHRPGAAGGVGGEPAVLVHTAAAEVGQGLVTVQAQIARTELGVEQVTIRPADTAVGSAGSSSASRQTYMTGGAVQAACEAVRGEAAGPAGAGTRPAAAGRRQGGRRRRRGAGRPGRAARRRGGRGDRRVAAPADRSRSTRSPGRATRTCSTRSPRTGPSSTSTSSSAWSRSSSSPPRRTSARRSTRRRVVGQIHGGTAQGLGLAVMEEIQVVDGKVRNPSFTDYLIPTILDMPPMRVDVLELADPHAPVRPARGRRAADDLVDAGDRGGDPGRDRAAADPRAGPPGAHHRHLTPDPKIGGSGASGVLQDGRDDRVPGRRGRELVADPVERHSVAPGISAARASPCAIGNSGSSVPCMTSVGRGDLAEPGPVRSAALQDPVVGLAGRDVGGAVVHARPRARAPAARRPRSAPANALQADHVVDGRRAVRPVGLRRRRRRSSPPSRRRRRQVGPVRPARAGRGWWTARQAGDPVGMLERDSSGAMPPPIEMPTRCAGASPSASSSASASSVEVAARCSRACRPATRSTGRCRAGRSGRPAGRRRRAARRTRPPTSPSRRRPRRSSSTAGSVGSPNSCTHRSTPLAPNDLLRMHVGSSSIEEESNAIIF